MGTCENCGAELPPRARFCPMCAWPIPRAGDEPQEPPANRPRRRRWAAKLGLAILVALNLVVLAFAVLVFAFGMFIEG